MLLSFRVKLTCSRIFWYVSHFQAAVGQKRSLPAQHDNIVKYIGFVATPECLNIILEYDDGRYPRDFLLSD